MAHILQISLSANSYAQWLNCSPLYNDRSNDEPKNAPEKLPSLKGHYKYLKVTDRLGQRPQIYNKLGQETEFSCRGSFLSFYIVSLFCFPFGLFLHLYSSLLEVLA